MSRNFSSTCNSKMNHIKDKIDHPDYQKLPQSESKVREISKPVKIAQLLGPFKQLQTGLRNSAIKVSQPERMTPYLKNPSTQKKNDKEANTTNRFHHGERNVRRNLIFTETPPTIKRTKQFVKASTNNLHDKFTVNDRTHSRKSFILPPDSIRNMHVAQNKFTRNKSMFPHLNQTRILTEKSVSKYPRISEESESLSPPVENANSPINNPVVQEKDNKTSVIQHTSSQTLKTNVRFVGNILRSYSSQSNASNDEVVKATDKHSDVDKISKVNVCSNQNSNGCIATDKPQIPSVHSVDARKNVNLYNGNYFNLETNAICTPGVEKITVEDTYAPLQTIKKISESCMDLQHKIDDDREYVTLSKKELILLVSNLESHLNFICRLEDNISYLKLTSTNIISLLSTKTMSEAFDDNEIENKKQMTENLSDNVKVINNVSTISSPNVQNIVTAVDDSLEGIPKTLVSDVLICAETNVPKGDHVEIQSSQQTDFTPVNDKENEKDSSSSVKCSKLRCGTRRRSARLMEKALKNSNVSNDSFVNLEHELNITSKKPVTPIISRMDRTPLTSGRKDKKKGRPWKEYMVMKSRMSCLLTPNIKRLDSTESKNNLHLETGAKRSLSNKILADLHNLYSDSPDLC